MNFGKISCIVNDGRKLVANSSHVNPQYVATDIERAGSVKEINKSNNIPFIKKVKSYFTNVITELKVKMLCGMTNVSLNMGKPYLCEYISKDFKQIKSQLLKSDLDKNFLKSVENCKSPEEMTELIKSFKVDETNKILRNKNKILISDMSKTEQEECLKVFDRDYASKMLNIEKSLSVPSKDPKVLEIESTLKDKYGFDFVSLKDDYEHARKVLKACELMSKNGEKLPENYIVSNMLPGTGQCLRANSSIYHVSSDLNGKLNPEEYAKKAKGLYSTEDELHSIIHEFGHNLQPSAIDTIELPAKFKKVPKTISKYANAKSNAELWAELYAKIQLSPNKVTKEQWELFEYLKSV